MKTGFPRPRIFVKTTSTSAYKRHKNGNFGEKWNNRWYPHPYTATEAVVSRISPQRLKESVLDKLCGVCGEHVEEDLVGLIIYNTRSPKSSKGESNGILHTESGPYHFKCLNIAFSTCPYIAEGKVFLGACGLWSEVGQQIADTFVLPLKLT